MAMTIVKGANLALAFFLELGVLGALAYWGFVTGQGTLGKVALGVGAVALAIIVWALVGAPKAAWRLLDPWRVLLHLVFFGSAVAALAFAGQPTLAVAFAALFLLNEALRLAFKQ